MEKILNELNKSPSSVKVLYEGFKKKQRIGGIMNDEASQQFCYDKALEDLDKAIDEQASLEEQLGENSKHYNLCLEKILFLRNIGRIEIAHEYCLELVEELPEYSNILLDVADFCCTSGEQGEAAIYREDWFNLNNEQDK